MSNAWIGWGAEIRALVLLAVIACSTACHPGASRTPALPSSGAAAVTQTSARESTEHHVGQTARPRTPRDDEAPPAWFATPLGWKAFEFVSLHGREELSRSYQFSVRVDVSDAAIDEAALLGTLATVGVRTSSGTTYFSGYVSQVDTVHGVVAGVPLEPVDRKLRAFDVTLVPWTWLLSKSAGSAVFQEHDVPGVIQRLLGGCDFADYRVELRGSYPKSAFFVQYRETDQNFLQRLVEHVGLTTFFRHGPDGHELVFADDARYLASNGPAIGLDSKTVDKVRTTSEVVTNRYVLRAGEPGATSAVFEGNAGLPSKYAFGGLEMYDIEGAAESARDVAFYARLREEEQQSSARRLMASVHDRAVRAGNIVNFTEFGAALDGSYVVVAADLDVSMSENQVAIAAEIQTVPATVPFRPQRHTAWPVIDGPQIARVIETSASDRARVKVRFQWTRDAPSSSDVWVPLTAAALGASGAPPVPGSDAIVDFLEGDPDRPVVVGIVSK